MYVYIHIYIQHVYIYVYVLYIYICIYTHTPLFQHSLIWANSLETICPLWNLVWFKSDRALLVWVSIEDPVTCRFSTPMALFCSEMFQTSNLSWRSSSFPFPFFSSLNSFPSSFYVFFRCFFSKFSTRFFRAWKFLDWSWGEVRCVYHPETGEVDSPEVAKAKRNRLSCKRGRPEISENPGWTIGPIGPIGPWKSPLSPLSPSSSSD